jgi:hypothetical protein
MTKRKKISKATPSQFVLLFIVSILFNYSVVSIGVAIVVLIIFFVSGMKTFESATLGNIFSILFGLLIFFPIRKLRKKLQEDSD